jgi:hypothetical protein
MPERHARVGEPFAAYPSSADRPGQIIRPAVAPKRESPERHALMVSTALAPGKFTVGEMQGQDHRPMVVARLSGSRQDRRGRPVVGLPRI